MNSGLLLDTCAAIWWTAGAPMTERSKRGIDRAMATAEVFVSPIAAWEVANLTALHRSPIEMETMQWYRELLGLGFAEVGLDARLLAASCNLPGDPHRDPADRIMIATARQHGFAIVTRDRRLLEYGARGHVKMLAC